MLAVNIEKKTLANKHYRKVIYTDKYMQLVLMSLKPGEDIPVETHNNVTQFIRIESGNGIAIIKNKKIPLKAGISVIISPKQKHYLKNNSKTNPLKLYTIYSPPEHSVNKINKRQP